MSRLQWGLGTSGTSQGMWFASRIRVIYGREKNKVLPPTEADINGPCGVTANGEQRKGVLYSDWQSELIAASFVCVWCSFERGKWLSSNLSGSIKRQSKDKGRTMMLRVSNKRELFYTLNAARNGCLRPSPALTTLATEKRSWLFELLNCIETERPGTAETLWRHKTTIPRNK
jgi:hypothetical protein